MVFRFCRLVFCYCTLLVGWVFGFGGFASWFLLMSLWFYTLDLSGVCGYTLVFGFDCFVVLLLLLFLLFCFLVVVLPCY